MTALANNTKQALEITLRNALDGLEALASYFAFQSCANSYEVISIEAIDHASLHTRSRAKSTAVITKVQPPRSQDIVSYLIQREQRQRCA